MGRQAKTAAIERAYAGYAGFYDLVFDRVLQPGRRAAVQALAPRRGDRVLEIGIGTGLSVPLYPPHCHITGIDLSAPMLREAEKKRAARYPLHDLDLIEMDAGDLQFPAGSFDRVLASYVLSTVPAPERVLDEIVRVSRPGGTIVIVNHFRSGFPPAALAERALRPLTWKLGFRLDLPIEVVSRHPRLRVVRATRTNILRQWTLLVCEVTGGPGREPASAGGRRDGAAM